MSLMMLSKVASWAGEAISTRAFWLVSALTSAFEDTGAMAVVLRINSPGGSALASDEIHRGVVRLADVYPVVVSMGRAAASGGYYMAAPADEIWAQPTTITGSRPESSSSQAASIPCGSGGPAR